MITHHYLYPYLPLHTGLFANPDESDAKTDRRSALSSDPSSSSSSAVGASRDRTRRWSFHGSDAESHSALVQAGIERARGMLYGNMALEYDMMLTSLHTLQTEVLNQFKETLNCEVASLFFANQRTRELLLCSSDGKWYRVPYGVGICGYCMETGDNVNIPEAYEDHRFNRYVYMNVNVYLIIFGVGLCTMAFLLLCVGCCRVAFCNGFSLRLLNNVALLRAISHHIIIHLFRLSRNMDVKTGFTTRSILCQPVRGMRGGGAIIGVIQMLNKRGAGAEGHFDTNDEVMLTTFTERVADIMSSRFMDLINIAEKFSGEV